MKKLLIICLLFLIGCQEQQVTAKTENKIKTSTHVRVHEIVMYPDDTTCNYWYIFFKDGKFIYVKSLIPVDDFSTIFFSSSQKIPTVLEFAEDFIRETDAEHDAWGFRQNDSIYGDNTKPNQLLISNFLGSDSVFFEYGID